MHIPRVLTSRHLNSEVTQRTPGRRTVKRRWADGAPLSLAVGSPGLLDTLHFVEDKKFRGQPLEACQVEIAVSSVGLNFQDVLVALGWISGQHVGCEVAGVVTQLGSSALSDSGLCVGDKVVALLVDSYRSSVRCDWRAVAKIPPPPPAISTCPPRPPSR